MSLLTRDMQNLSTAAGQVFHNFLKEGDTQRFSREDLIQICCVLTTAEYCLETVQQLEDKLKEKISTAYANKIDMSEEKDVFHRLVANNCIYQVCDFTCFFVFIRFAQHYFKLHTIAGAGFGSGL